MSSVLARLVSAPSASPRYRESSTRSDASARAADTGRHAWSSPARSTRAGIAPPTRRVTTPCGPSRRAGLRPCPAIAATDRIPRSRWGVRGGHLPLVVSRRAPLVANRRLLALADDTNDAGALGCPLTATPTRLLPLVERLEVVIGHRVFVFLAQELPLHQRVDRRRVLIVVLRPIEIDRERVLLHPEEQLGLFLPLRLVAPDRQQRRHHDPHHRHCHQARRHRIPALAALTL